MYLGANALYAWALIQPMPTGGFKWLKEDKWDDIFKYKWDDIFKNKWEDIFKNKECDLLNVIWNIQKNYMIYIMITPLPLKN